MPTTPDVGRPVALEPADANASLLELLDRVIDKGVVLGGDLTLSVANIDLLYLGVRLLLCSADRIPGWSPVKER
jgi:hypothetical protein